MSTTPLISDINALCLPCRHQETGGEVCLSGTDIMQLGNAVAGASAVFLMLQKSNELRALREALAKGEIAHQHIDAPLCDVSEYGLFRGLEALLHSIQVSVESLEVQSQSNTGPGALPREGGACGEQ